MKISKVLSFVQKMSLNSIRVNFRYFPFLEAIRLPILVSRNVYLHTLKGRIVLEGPITTGRVQIGFGDVSLFDRKRSRCVLEILGTITFEGQARIGHGSKISVGPNGYLRFGEGFKISAESSIVAYSKVTFGKHCLISWDNLIMDTDFHTIRDKFGKVINDAKPITIGDHVWIGCRCLILKGTQIPNNSIIASSSLLNKHLDGENRIFGGAPVKELKKDVTWS